MIDSSEPLEDPVAPSDGVAIPQNFEAIYCNDKDLGTLGTPQLLLVHTTHAINLPRPGWVQS